MCYYITLASNFHPSQPKHGIEQERLSFDLPKELANDFTIYPTFGVFLLDGFTEHDGVKLLKTPKKRLETQHKKL